VLEIVAMSRATLSTAGATAFRLKAGVALAPETVLTPSMGTLIGSKSVAMIYLKSTVPPAAGGRTSSGPDIVDLADVGSPLMPLLRPLSADPKMPRNPAVF